MIEYIKGENGEPLNIRGLSGKLRDFRVTQGCCSDGKNIYMIFERQKLGRWTHRCRILKLDGKTFKLLKVSQELKIGHGNDVTYHNGNLYVTHSAGGKIVHRVNAFTLAYEEMIRVTIPKELGRKRIRAFNGIARYGNGFILRIMYGTGMLITDDDFKALRHFRTRRFYKTSQGMDQKGLVTYRAYSKLQSEDRNYLATFDEEGRVISRTRLEVTGELESVFFMGDQLYGTVYRKEIDSRGRLKRDAYIIRIFV